MSLRILAIDWSGAKQGAQRKIWLAEVGGGRVLRLERDRSRDEIVEELAALRASDPELVVGLDFAFSMPGWWVRERGLASAPELWGWLAAGHAEEILARCPPPFWGRTGKRKQPLPPDQLLRRTDAATNAGCGVASKSIFQIGGAGAVGTGSLRGMCRLRDLRQTGFSVWPMDEGRLPRVVEIYPRALTGPVVKSREAARREHLRRYAERMTPEMLEHATGSDDAFDAAVSALEMWSHREDLLRLPCISDERLRLEGIIWQPRWREAHGV